MTYSDVEPSLPALNTNDSLDQPEAFVGCPQLGQFDVRLAQPLAGTRR